MISMLTGLKVLSSYLLPELWSTKCKNGSFFLFSSDDSKKPVIVWSKHLSGSEKSHLAFLGFWAIISKMSDFGIFCWLNSFSDISTLNISKTVTLYHFLKDLSGALKYFAQTVTNVLLPSVENTKMSHFWHFNGQAW